jgi:hypothetical protein
LTVRPAEISFVQDALSAALLVSTAQTHFAQINNDFFPVAPEVTLTVDGEETLAKIDDIVSSSGSISLITLRGQTSFYIIEQLTGATFEVRQAVYTINSGLSEDDETEACIIGFIGD